MVSIVEEFIIHSSSADVLETGLRVAQITSPCWFKGKLLLVSTVQVHIRLKGYKSNFI